MPADIRNFFGGGDSSSAAPNTASKNGKTAKTDARSIKKRRQRVIESDEEEESISINSDDDFKPNGARNKTEAVRSSPRTKTAPKRVETDTSSYFANSNAVSRVKATRGKNKADTMEDDEFGTIDDEDLVLVLSDDEVPASKSQKPSITTPAKKAPTEIKDTKPDEEASEKNAVVQDDLPVRKLASTVKQVPPAKNASGHKKTVSTSSAKKTTPKKAASKEKPDAVSKEVKNIFDDIPDVELQDIAVAERSKFVFGSGNAGPAPMAGTKEIPVAQENCLSGLTFVFTGMMPSLDREVAQNLVKQYGGRITTAPSTKTNFVVVGENAGANKIKTIKEKGLKAIDEDGFLHLLEKMPANGGTGGIAQKAAEKRKQENKEVVAKAKEFAETEASLDKGKGKGKGRGNVSATQLWTEKYAPTKLEDVCGNKGLVTKLRSWLKEWPKNAEHEFKRPGPEGTGLYRAVLLSGPPGIGKTTAAHLVTGMEGYDVLEFNASDTRSEKLLRESLSTVIDNKSLSGYFGTNLAPKDKQKRRLVIIMDEVDGMSAGDRGGVGAMAKLIRKTKVPIICICNDKSNQKMRPFDRITLEMTFRRPEVNMIRSRIMSIAYKEGLQIEASVIDQLVQGTGSDIRQILNMLSTFRLGSSDLKQAEGRQVVQQSEKHIVMKPWDICGKFLSSGMFSESSKMTLNDKIELYFNDHEFSYLMIQENYLRTRPTLAERVGPEPKAKNFKALELAENAASSISDGDLVDAMIHGTQQQWSLMPVHGVFSCVRPASFVYGAGNGRYGFTAWLGQNSKQGKLSRMLREIQAHMRIKISADRHEVRQSYIPVLFDLLAKPLIGQRGAESIDEVISTMDDYYLTKEDWEAMLELGVGPNEGEPILSSIQSKTKASFTRLYNGKSHPIAFNKASNVVATRASKKDQPDMEDAIEADEEEPTDDTVVIEDETDLSKDKMVKAINPKGTAGKAGNATSTKRTASSSSAAGTSKRSRKK